MPLINAAMQGLVQAETTLERTADRIARFGQAPAAGDSVSLSDEAVSLIAARNAYEMNLQSLKTGDEMTRKLLDVLA